MMSVLVHRQRLKLLLLLPAVIFSVAGQRCNVVIVTHKHSFPVTAALDTADSNHAAFSVVNPLSDALHL